MHNSEVGGKIYAWAIEVLGMSEVGKKGWLGGDCPHCGKERKFGIHVGSNTSNCFVCGTRMKLINLVMYVHELKTYSEAISKLDRYEGFKIQISHEREVDVIQKVGDEILPEGFKLLSLGNSRTAQLARHCMTSRKFSVARLTALGVGYTGRGSKACRVIIPYYENGKIIYYNARAITKAGMKYDNPKEEEVGIGKNQVIYNIDILRYATKVWIFEGVLNALTIGMNATNIGGKEISLWQLSQYIKSPCKKFVIALDDDAYPEALALGLKLAAAGKKVKVLKFPTGKDANDLGRKETLKLEKAQSYMNYNELLKLNMNYDADQEATEYTYNRVELIKYLHKSGYSRGAKPIEASKTSTKTSKETLINSQKVTSNKQ